MNEVILSRPRYGNFNIKDLKGDIFNLDGDPFIFSQVDNEVYALISIVDGNRWQDPSSYEEATNLEELLEILKDEEDYDTEYVGKCVITLNQQG